MAYVAAALTELEAVEAFLRKRYHYPHPIFERLATAQAYLEREDAPPEKDEPAKAPKAAAAPKAAPQTAPPPAPHARTKKES